MKNKDDNIHKNEVYQQFQHSKKIIQISIGFPIWPNLENPLKIWKEKYSEKKTAHTDLTDGRADLTYRSSV